MKDTDLCFTFSKFDLKQTAVPDKFFAKVIRVLETLVAKLPGMTYCYLMLIKAHVLNGTLDQAQSYVDKMLEKETVSQQTHVYSLYLALTRGFLAKNDEEAQRVLTNSTSSNFELLQNPILFI